MATLSKRKLIVYGLAASIALNVFLAAYASSVTASRNKYADKYKTKEARVVRTAPGQQRGGDGPFRLEMAKRHMSEGGQKIVDRQLQKDADVLTDKFTELRGLRRQLSNVMRAPE
ncbi:MAG: hypothetical protein FWF01_03650, partial [Alphaproteobacteria bacterium]|nr:hypothetical protein [Alphaproteobacteria bacterium]